MESRWRLWRKRQYIYWSRCPKLTAVACILKPPRGPVEHEGGDHVLGEELTGIYTVTKSARCARAMPARCCVFRWRRSARLWAGMRFSSLRAISCPMCCIGISSSWPGSAIGTLSSVSASFRIPITFFPTRKLEAVDHVVVDCLKLAPPSKGWCVKKYSSYMAR